MELNPSNFDDFSGNIFNNEPQIEGINGFIKNLEKHFFSQVTIRNCSPSNNSINLVIELDCNLELIETLHHFEKDNWGNFKSLEYSFEGALNQLKKSNKLNIEIEEFSIFLKDISIIIKRVNKHSIANQLENIFIELNKHHIYLTKGLSEIPFEIYVSVFEEDITETENTLLSLIQSRNDDGKQDYFSFWGVYYDSEDDAVIYDLKNKKIIKGNLQMLNR